MNNWQFTAPGGLKDFKNPDDWHQAMLREAQGIVEILVVTALGRKPLSQAEFDSVAANLAYINPAETLPPNDAETLNLTPWPAFPKAVKVQAPWIEFPANDIDGDGSYRAADTTGAEDYPPGVFVDGNGQQLNLPTRHRQDEYCEWVLRKDAQNRIRKAIFVAEGYDYFSELFKVDEKRVVEIYQDFTETKKIAPDELRARDGIFFRHSNGDPDSVVAAAGDFNPRNPFNISPGIVHLSHRANSLGAEVNLAGVSGIARRLTSGSLLDGVDAQQLLCCAEGGNPNRNSDPLISKQAYEQVMNGKHYTLANPVGLYIAKFDDQRLTLADGTPAPKEWWKTTRGTDSDKRILRLELEVPASEKMVLQDLLVDGVNVRYGGQLADLLSIHLFVTRWDRSGGGTGPAVSCEATCCQKNGTQILTLSAGKCGQGYTLKYPGLVVGPIQAAALLAAVDAPARAPARAGVTRDLTRVR